MSWLKTPIYKFLAAFICGVLGAHFDIWEIDVFLVLVSSLIAIIGFYFLVPLHRFFKWCFAITTIILFVAAGGYSYQQSDVAIATSHFTHHYLPGTIHSIQLELTDQLAPNRYNERFYAQLHAVDEVGVDGRVLVLLKKSNDLNLRVGEVITTFDDISQASDARNPGDFNYKEYLQGIGVYGQVYLDADRIVSRRYNPDLPFYKKWRYRLLEQLDKSGLTHRTAGFVKALLLGQRQDIEVSVTQSFRSVGVIHILALSGLHVGVLLLLLKHLTSWLSRFKWGKWVQTILIITCLWIFALITGMSPSITRSVTMFSFLAVAFHFHKKGSTYQGLALSALVLLLVYPRWLFHVGFQLSYTAVFAIAFLQPVLRKLWYPKWWALKFLWSIATVTIAAQLGVAPLSLFYFHQFPGLFLPANLFLLPLLPLLLFTFISYIILLQTPIELHWLEFVLNGLIDIIVGVVEWLGQFKQFLVTNVFLDLIDVLCVYAILWSIGAFLFNWARRGRRFKGIRIRANYGLHLALLASCFWLIRSTYQRVDIHQNESGVLHLAMGSVMTVYNDHEAHIYADFSAIDSSRVAGIKDRLSQVTWHRDKEIRFHELDNSYLQPQVLRVTAAVYPDSLSYHPVVWLSHSPKIHLGKLIDQLQPSSIIVDGSNYRSMAQKWEQTCRDKGVPLWNTYERGAVLFNSLEGGK